MSFCHDKQIRGYLLFLSIFSMLILIINSFNIALQEQYTKETYFSHDHAIASSLLEQGISKDIIANALTNQSTSENGKALLAMLGVEEQHKSLRVFYITAITNIILIMLLFWGTHIFFEKRRRLYLQAEKVLNYYIDGNYSYQLPQDDEGIIYRLFVSINQLATMLQAKNETEQKAKDFLKRTISDISHQLKTPLAALTMYQEIIEAEPDNVETVKEFALKIGTACKRMEQLIQAMLKCSCTVKKQATENKR